MKKIAVIGLGYVGLPLAVEFGKNRSIFGFDVDIDRVNDLSKGYDHTLECSEEQIKDAANLTFTSNLKDLEKAKIFIVTVPTPVDSANRPDLSSLMKATKLIASILKKGDIVIYESTVYPGATEDICAKVLENSSGLKFNIDFFCGYSPERINPGDKVNTLTTIKKITSGSNTSIAEEVDILYKSIITAGTWKASSIKVAEAAKVIENSQIDLNIAFVNELSLIFERIGIDTIEVLEAAGSKWNFLQFRPGMVGGHCIGIDPYYLTHKAEEVGYQPQVILAGRRINDEMARHAARSIIKKMLLNKINVSNSTIAIFGLTFKDNCPDTRNSKAFDLIDELKLWGVNVILLDPWVNKDQIREQHGYEVTDISSRIKVDSIIVCVGHNQFKNIDIDYFRSICQIEKPVFGDLKSIYSKEDLELAGFTVMRL